MAKFYIRYGLGGGFGGCERNDWEETECFDLAEAQQEAYLGACEEYESYAGMHGLRDIGQIQEEYLEDEGEELTEEDAIEMFKEEREDWLDYEAVSEKPDDFEDGDDD